MDTINNGIQISGGIFNADNLAVGKKASASKKIHTAYPSQVQHSIDVLLVFATPHSLPHLNLAVEDRSIREAIRLSRYRDCISLTVLHAATIHDLRRALLNQTFQIVHLAVHGTQHGLILEDEQGHPYSVPLAPLAEVFRSYHTTLQAIVLNACYSISQGTLLSSQGDPTTLGIPYIIAIDGPLSDIAAIEFARGFYDAIGAGKDIASAYAEGCRTVNLAASGLPFNSLLLKNTHEEQS